MSQDLPTWAPELVYPQVELKNDKQIDGSVIGKTYLQGEQVSMQELNDDQKEQKAVQLYQQARQLSAAAMGIVLDPEEEAKRDVLRASQ